jgi:hypothetical protein
MADKYERNTMIVSLDTVLAAFAEQYERTDGSTILKIDSFVDAGKGKAIFVIDSVRNVPDGAE